MKPSLVFMMRLSGSVKFFCAFGSGASDGGAAGLPGFLVLRPSASRFLSASARALRSASAAALASGSSSALAARIFSARRFLSPTHFGISSPLLSRPKPAIDAVDPLDLPQIDLLDHQVQDEPRQVILVDELLNRRRQQHRLIDLPGAIALAHEQAESNSSPHRQRNPGFLRQAPSSARRCV